MKLHLKVDHHAYNWPVKYRGKNVTVVIATVYLPDGERRDSLYGAEMIESDAIWEPGMTLKERRYNDIIQALKHFNGNRMKAATDLGLDVRQLYYKLDNMRERGIKIPDGRKRIKDND